MTARSLAAQLMLFGAALLTGAASPPSIPLLASSESMLRAPAPVVAPAPVAPSAFTPAPVPDIDQAPVPQKAAASGDPQLTPSFFHQAPAFMGDGYTPNSTVVQSEQSRRIGPAGGLNLSVPLQ